MNPPNDALVAIATSFKGITRPDTLLHPRCSDDNDIKLFERTTHWEMIPDRWIEAENAALSVASAKGFQYLLPAYLSFSIRNILVADISVDHVIYALNPSGETAAFQESKYELLTEAQRDSIRLFLKFLSLHRNRIDWNQAKQATVYWSHQ